MKNSLSLCLALAGIICFSFDSLAQSKLKMELYGGPQYSYQKSVTRLGQELNTKSQLDYHLGINFLFGLRDDLQLSFQSETVRPNFSFDYFPAYPSLTPNYQAKRIDAFGNYRLGIRKTWEQGNHAFYVQPSI